MKRIFLFLSVILLTQYSGAIARICCAESVAEKTLVFATPENEGRFTLYQQEVYKEVSKRTGVRCILKVLPKKRCLVDANKGFYAGVAARVKGLGTDYTNLRMADVSHFTVQHILFAKKTEIAETVQGTESLISQSMTLDYAVGHLRGSKKAQRLLVGLPEAKIYTFDNPEACFTALNRGLIGAYLAGPGIVNRAILKKKFQTDGIKEISVISETKLFPYVHVKYESFIPTLEKTLQSMIDDGTLNRIRKLLE